MEAPKSQEAFQPQVFVASGLGEPPIEIEDGCFCICAGMAGAGTGNCLCIQFGGAGYPSC